MTVCDLFFLFAGLFPLLSIISLRAGDMLAASRIGNVGQAGGRGVRGSRGGQVKLEDSAGASNPKRAKKQRPNLSNQTCYNCNGNPLSFSASCFTRSSFRSGPHVVQLHQAQEEEELEAAVQGSC